MTEPPKLPPNSELFRQTRFDASERLDKHLALAIADLKPESPKIMRGMQRLAHLTSTAMANMDAQADAVADRIVAGQARAAVVIQKFGALADGIEQTANEVEAALGQISNDPTQVSGSSTI